MSALKSSDNTTDSVTDKHTAYCAGKAPFLVATTTNSSGGTTLATETTDRTRTPPRATMKPHSQSASSSSDSSSVSSGHSVESPNISRRTIRGAIRALEVLVLREPLLLTVGMSGIPPKEPWEIDEREQRRKMWEEMEGSGPGDGRTEVDREEFCYKQMKGFVAGQGNGWVGSPWKVTVPAGLDVKKQSNGSDAVACREATTAGTKDEEKIDWTAPVHEWYKAGLFTEDVWLELDELSQKEKDCLR